MRGQLLYYTSRLDDTLQPLPVCSTGEGKAEKPLLLDVSPGAISSLSHSVRRCEELASWAAVAGASCVVAKPCGRGPGTVYQGPGEVDLWEAVECLGRNFRIDRDRIGVLGASMGGAATWYLASHYADRLAAAAPFCGYCDYRLWTKPGGTILRMQPWEVASWQARDAAFRPENLSHVGLWITHGEWDTAIGGGVPVEHSRRMHRALKRLGIPHTYTEVPRCGHGCLTESTARPVLSWLCEQRRVEQPDRIRLVAHGLRHSRLHWVEVQQMERYGRAARVEAMRNSGDRIGIRTENVLRLALGPRPGRKRVGLMLDGQVMGPAVLSSPVAFEKADGRWRRCASGAPGPGEKRPGASGPIGDLFFAPLRLVKGTAGSDQESFLHDWMAGHLPAYFKQKNGGVHRGIFDGESLYDLPVTPDRALLENDLHGYNLILLGTFRSNAVLARWEGKLPLEIGDRSIRLGSRTYRGRQLGLCACFPSPENPDRLVAVIGGVNPEAATGATHLNLQLLPDYLVWEGDEVLDFGFFDNQWQKC